MAYGESVIPHQYKTMYYIRRDSRVIGPVTGREFASRLQKEQIRWTDEVATARQGPFVVIAEYSELDDVLRAVGLHNVTEASESAGLPSVAETGVSPGPVPPPVSERERGKKDSRPASVTLAVRLLWVCLGLGLLESVLALCFSNSFAEGVQSLTEIPGVTTEQAQGLFSALIVASLLVYNGLLVLGITLLKRRRRWVCYVLWVLSVVMIIGMPFRIYQLWGARANPYSFAACVSVAIAAGGVQVAASIALLQRASSRWFEKLSR